MLALIVTVSYQYGFNAVGNTDQSVNLTGTAYADTYNTSVNTTKASFAFVSWEGMLLGVVALVFVLLIIMGHVNRY